MKKRRLLLTILAAVVCLAFIQRLAVNGQNEQAQLPTGKWSFSAGPYSGPGYESAPVDVYGVKTDADKGLAVASVYLKNRTSKDVIAVKLRWILTDKDNNQILVDGVTQSIGVAVAAGGRQVLNYPVASFAKIVKNQLKRASLQGNYRLEVMVSEVTYQDESSSVIKRDKTDISNAAHLKRSFPSCQNQGCLYNAEIGSYQCNPNTGTYCSVQNKGKSCLETRCDDGGGSDLPPTSDS